MSVRVETARLADQRCTTFHVTREVTTDRGLVTEVLDSDGNWQVAKPYAVMQPTAAVADSGERI